MKAGLVFLFTVFGLTQAHLWEGCATSPLPLTPDFCARPPVDEVDLSFYSGKWYQSYVNEIALTASGEACVTANYTLIEDGSIDVLNCQTLTPGNVTCVQAKASRRSNGNSPSHLQVQFPPLPPGPYNVAALLGDKEYGYYAAAVYSCEAPFPGMPDIPTWYFIVRNPYLSDLAFKIISNKLKCKGYDLSNERFIETRQGAGCDYFDGTKGFEYVSIPSAGGPGQSSGAGTSQFDGTNFGSRAPSFSESS